MYYTSPFWYSHQPDPNYLEDDSARKRPRLTQGTNNITAGVFMSSTTSLALPTNSYDLTEAAPYWQSTRTCSPSHLNNAEVYHPWEAFDLSQSSSSSYYPGQDSSTESFAIDFEGFDINQIVDWEDTSLADQLLSQQAGPHDHAIQENGQDNPLEDSACCYGMVIFSFPRVCLTCSLLQSYQICQ